MVKFFADADLRRRMLSSLRESVSSGSTSFGSIVPETSTSTQEPGGGADDEETPQQEEVQQESDSECLCYDYTLNLLL